LRAASIVFRARCVGPIVGSDIGTRSIRLDPLASVITNGEPHCFGLLINGNDVRYGPHVDSARVDVPVISKILCDH
jgi:hypothetical protein